MNRSNPLAIALFPALASSLAACSPEPASVPDAASSARDANAPATPAPAPPPKASPPPPLEAGPAPKVLTLEGLGELRIGEPVPAGSSWTERGAQIPGSCRIISSPNFPAVHAIVENGAVRRITIGAQSKIKLREGIGTGAAEDKVRSVFSDLLEEPHKYVEKPAKYLTTPNAAGGDPALRFEFGREGRVSLIHVGTMPVLGYVEGCA